MSCSEAAELPPSMLMNPPGIDFDEDHTLDCRSSAGETVGLIDASIHVLRLVARSDLTHPAVTEALRDLAEDPEVQIVLAASRRVVDIPISTQGA